MKFVEAGGRRILFVMAVAAEYGAELARRFRPLFTGVGPVESSQASRRLAARSSRSAV